MSNTTTERRKLLVVANRAPVTYADGVAKRVLVPKIHVRRGRARMRLKSGRAVKNNDLGTEQMVALRPLRPLRAGLIILLSVRLLVRSLAVEKTFQVEVAQAVEQTA